MSSYVFHLIANAHLDPVWLWDAREGLNEGVQTCRTVCDLLDEDPDITFIRGEAAIYQHIERTDPSLFARIRGFIEAGRWDIVGGTYIQPDTNLPATEILVRHYLRGQRYFASRFGRRARIAWAADSFGHSGGLPDILASAGMEGFAFTRPFPDQLPLPRPAFWWQGVGGARILAYRPPAGWYGTERDEIPRRLDAALAAAAGGGLTNVGVFYGVGNHGGGPTRRQIADIRAWGEAHPEVQMVHSGLTRLFDALRAEIATQPDDFLPVHSGELGFCLRGCYATAAKIKYAYRQTEALVSRAETTDTVLAVALDLPPADLSEAWDSVLFNSFHDILPGTSIERALEEQWDQMAGARHQARQAEFARLNALAARVDTTVPAVEGDHPTAVPLLVWNPHPFPIDGLIELEAALDYRPLFGYRDRPDQVPLDLRGPDGAPLPFQRLSPENLFTPPLPWRARVLVPAQLPPMGWSVYTLGLGTAPSTPAPEEPAKSEAADSIAAGSYRISARVGEEGILILRNGASLFGEAGLSAVTVADPYGSWGDMSESPAAIDLSEVIARWTITQVKVLETGKYRSRLWVRMTGGSSWVDLTFSLTASGSEAIEVAARVLWNERGARLKLVMPVGADSAEFDIPGGSLRRSPLGEVPGGRWVQTPKFGFASDALYNFDLKAGTLRATICRATRYAADGPLPPDESPWLPAMDSGELRLRFLLTSVGSDVPRLARQLEQPPVVLTVPAGPGDWPRMGTLAALSPASSLTLLACKPAEDGNGWIVRVQTGDIAESEGDARLTWLGELISLGRVPRRAICTWRILPGSDGAQAVPVSATEDEVEPSS